MKTLVYRCEATPALGAGHAFRGLALAQEWAARGGRALFAMVQPEPAIADRLRDAGLGVATLAVTPGSADDARATARLAEENSARWVAIDGPMFGTAWEAGWPGAPRLLRVDDNGLSAPFRADVLLNQNLGASPGDYPAKSDECWLLLGPDYALLRREFLAARTAGVQSQPRLVVTMGGSDPARGTELALAALCEYPADALSADFVIGPANPRREALVAALARHAPRLVAHVAPAHLPHLLARAGLALTAGGTTLYELACLRVPMLIVATAENQRRTCERFDAVNAADYAGWHGDLTPARLAGEIMAFWTESETLRTLASRAARLVDGRGAARVVDALLALDPRRSESDRAERGGSA